MPWYSKRVLTFFLTLSAHCLCWSNADFGREHLVSSSSSVLDLRFVSGVGHQAAPAGYSTAISEGNATDLLSKLHLVPRSGRLDARAHEGYGWPRASQWYTAPGPNGVGAYMRKSQHPSDYLSLRHAALMEYGFSDTDSVVISTRVGAPGDCVATAESVAIMTNEDRLVAGCVQVDLTHAASGIGRGSFHFAVRTSCPFPVQVMLWEATPWFISSLPHSISFIQDGGSSQPVAADRVIVQRAIIRGQPGVASWNFLLRDSSAIHASYRYEGALLHAEELPAQAHHGVELLPVHVAACRADESSLASVCSTWWIPPVLVELPAPDFSMPYNVITFVSTVAAFTAGSVLNAIGRKPRRAASVLKV